MGSKGSSQQLNNSRNAKRMSYCSDASVERDPRCVNPDPSKFILTATVMAIIIARLGIYQRRNGNKHKKSGRLGKKAGA